MNNFLFDKWHSCWSGNVLFGYHSVIHNEDFTFLDTSSLVWVYVNIFIFDIFGFAYPIRTFIPRQNLSSINMAWNDIDENNNFHLDASIKYWYLSGITILIPTYRLFDTIIHVGYWYLAFTTYHTNISMRCGMTTIIPKWINLHRSHETCMHT